MKLATSEQIRELGLRTTEEARTEFEDAEGEYLYCIENCIPLEPDRVVARIHFQTGPFNIQEGARVFGMCNGGYIYYEKIRRELPLIRQEVLRAGIGDSVPAGAKVLGCIDGCVVSLMPPF